MSIELKYTELLEKDLQRLNRMEFREEDYALDPTVWLANAKERINFDINHFEKLAGVYLGEEQ